MEDNPLNTPGSDCIDKLTPQLSEPKMIIVGGIGKDNTSYFRKMYELAQRHELIVIMSPFPELPEPVPSPVDFIIAPLKVITKGASFNSKDFKTKKYKSKTNF